MPDRESISTSDHAYPIGSFVRARRRANKLTQRQLAELAAVGTRVVSEMERGKPTMRMDVVNAVLAVFGKRLGIDELPRDCHGLEPEPEPSSDRRLGSPPPAATPPE